MPSPCTQEKYSPHKIGITERRGGGNAAPLQVAQVLPCFPCCRTTKWDILQNIIRSMLQEQRWNNQGQAVQVFEAEPENETYLLPGTKEKPKVQVDEGRNCYPTSFKFVSLARLSKKTQKSTPWDLTFSSRSLRETSQIK